MADKKGWKTVSSSYPYQSRWLKVRHDEVIRPNGKPGSYDVIEKPDAVAIIPFVGNKLYLVDQYRYPTKERSLEVPQGGVDGNEPPEQAAKRELQEETGLIASSLTPLGFFWLANGHHTQGYHLFLAENCTEGNSQREESEDDMEIKTATFEEMKNLIKEGKIKDGPTLATICRYLLYIE